ncbi:MAG TPA: VWA domain-containing protein [Gammaproteobacteria bacterium]|nr:VWA domain-containing protein [Gammaproteobacteria bacterium]
MKPVFRPLVILLFIFIAVPFAASAVAEQAVVLIIDNSGSMMKNDPRSLAKQAVAQFIQDVPLGTRVALVMFDKKVQILAPLTLVTETTRLDLLTHLSQINYKGPLTNSGDALNQGLEELKKHGGSAAEQYIVFLTDGIVDTGNVARDLKMAEKMRGELAQAAAEAHIRIFAIAFTDNADKKLMQDLAQTTGGAYFQPMRPEDLPQVFASINASLTPAPSSSNAEAKTPAETPAAAPAEAAPEEVPPPSAAESAEALETPSPQASEVAPALPPEMPKETAPIPQTPTTPNAPELPPTTTSASSNPPESPSNWMTIMAISTVGLTLFLSSVSLLLMYRMSEAHKHEQNLLREAQGNAPKAMLYLGNRKKRLRGTQGKDVFDVTGKTTLVGRAPGPGGVIIPDEGISRQHAVIEYRDYTYWLIDQSSANGTFINDERTQGIQRLNHGDRVRFHQTEFLFLMPGRDDVEQTVIVPRGETLGQMTS